MGSVASYRKRILFWFTTLALILACIPAGPTPVPTLRPDEVNLFIQQTADAASIQTLTAFPTGTIVPTFTATPRNTFTPEATTTPFVTFVFPTSTPTQRIQFFRVKHDSQLEMYDYKSRTAGPKWKGNAQTPEVVPLFAAPKDASGTHRTVIDGGWEHYLNDLNGFDNDKLDYLKGKTTALFNGSGFPNLESLTMGGNVITLDEIQGSWGRVHTMDYNKVETVDEVNYMTRPDLVHKFVVVVWSRRLKTTYWVNPPKGSMYWPLVSKFPVWIPMERLEPFPILPMLVTAKVDQDILTEPNRNAEKTGDTLLKGRTATVVEYFPAGSQVWGRLLGGSKWIALFRYDKGAARYFTTWSMATLPPP